MDITLATQMSMALIFIGAAVLVISLSYARIIIHENREFSRSWLLLAVLIGLFIAGYLAFAYLILQRDVSTLEVIASAIFCIGSFFVLTISRMSLGSLQETKRIIAMQQHHALHDNLTRLPNRTFFLNHLAEMTNTADPAIKFAVLMMDLDRFRHINETLGHNCGDLLLQEVGMRLHRNLRRTDMLARLGGDEFGVLIQPVTDIDDLRKISTHIVSVLHEPITLSGYPTDIGISIGAALYPEHGDTENALMKHAEIAMYEAKQNTHDIVIYEAALATKSPEELSILGDLRQAIEDDHLVVHYQPQIQLDTGALCGVEALIRWTHPRLGNLMPDDFIPLAEESGMIKALYSWLLDVVLDQLAEWQSAGIQIPISTNLSAINLHDINLFDYVAASLRSRAITPRSLHLEITESAVMLNPEKAINIMRRLHDIGVLFSIDDYGTGYSSLHYLKRLPVNEIKIDKSFIIDMMRDPNSHMIIRSTIELAHNMNRTIIAEGVENEDVLHQLRELGCDKAQGYYIGEPMPIDDLNHWIKYMPHKLQPNLAS